MRVFYFATGETGLDKKKKNLVVKGLHNWYQFHLEQTAGRLTYTPPPTNKVDTTKKVMASCALAMISKDYFQLIQGDALPKSIANFFSLFCVIAAAIYQRKIFLEGCQQAAG